MDVTDKTQEDWTPCRQGDVSNLIHALKSRRQAKKVQRRLAVTGALMAVAAVGYYFAGLRPTDRFDYGGIACSEVAQSAQKFVSGDLDDETQQKIEEHLAHCPHCRKLVDDLRKRTGRDTTTNLQFEELPADRFTVDVTATGVPYQNPHLALVLSSLPF
jgi:hypothetical protein